MTAKRRRAVQPRRTVRILDRLGRLGIRRKLLLLPLLPLAACLLVTVPFVTSEVNDAGSAGTTADTARQARELGVLVSELQHERLLTAAYVASSNAPRADMEQQRRVVDDTAASVRAALGPGASDELAAALVRLGSLQEIRQNASQRGVSLDSVARTYHAVIEAVIDALRLVPQRTSDAEGTRQLTALEALLRAGEQSSLRGMALIVASVSPQTGTVLLDDASAQAQLLTERFVQQADVEHAALVVRVEQGDEARRVDELTGRLPDGRDPDTTEEFVTDARAAVESQASLRRLVQDQVTSQITDAAAGRASSARGIALMIGLGAALLLALVAFLSIAVGRSIANPLRRLTHAATTVADLAESELVRVTDSELVEEQTPRLGAIDLSSRDELGELATAFNRVQATAAMLVERQAVTRRNVSLMFANVAQRTQNLVGRQLTLVDELERNEQDARLLERLYRLDHLSTRLRRSADNLLVVAGSRDDTKLSGPTELATALRSALAEIEDYQRVRLGNIPDLTLVSSLGSDLILMFAELLENATSFSPPQSVVEIGTGLLAGGACVVSIVDHGIGMTPERLAEENRRLVERERLDVAPTSVLGLFVVGRLARRHQLSVDLVMTPGGGVTARVAIPATLVNRPMEPEPVPELVAAQPRVAPTRLLPVPELKIPSAQHIEGFSWFPPGAPAQQQQQQQQVPAISRLAATSRLAVTAPARANRSGLRRRVAGAQLPGNPAAPRASAPPDRPVHNAAAARTAMDGYQSAIARAAGSPPPQSSVRSPGPPAPASRPDMSPGAERPGLSQRIPGANLAPGLRRAIPDRRPTRSAAAGGQVRDPDAERAAFDSFTTGIARAAAPGDTVHSRDVPAGRDPDPGRESTA